MNLKRTALLVGAVIALLLPAGQIIRTQNPWNCFNFTYDESYFGQASQNWVEGKGYRMHGGKPFDPTITSGIVLPWGAKFIQNFTRDDLLYSGRIFVHLCLFLLLLSVAAHAYRQQNNWAAVPLAVGIFAYVFSRIPIANYMAFGFLGEAPALLVASFTYRMLDKRMFLFAAILSVAVFFTKPTFLLFIPAVWLTILLRNRRSAIISAFGVAAALCAGFGEMLRQRGESANEYFKTYFSNATQVAIENSPGGNFFSYYEHAGIIPSAFSALVLITGSIAFIRARRLRDCSHLTAYLSLVMTAVIFLASGKEPVLKQWSAVLVLVLIGFSTYWGNLIGSKIAGWIPKEYIRAVVISVAATFLFAVGQNAHHHYKRIPETSCPSKEQSAINRELRKLVDSGQVTPHELRQLVKSESYSNYLYKIGWDVPRSNSWRTLDSPRPQWVSGENSALFPCPSSCKPYWSGRTFSIVECSTSTPPGKPAPSPKDANSKNRGFWAPIRKSSRSLE